MPKLVLARGDISPTDELVIVLSEPDSEPAAVLIHWPTAASVASPIGPPTVTALAVAPLWNRAVQLWAATDQTICHHGEDRCRCRCRLDHVE